MKEPPKEICPRIPLTETMKREAEFYIFNSAVRGLYDSQCIDFTIFKDLLCPHPESLEACRNRINQLPASIQSRFYNLYSIKRLGIHGEIAFHHSRGSDYRIAFEVARSYIHHNQEIKGVIKYPYTYPDACLDPSVPVINRCSASKTVDIKTEGRKERNEYVGLSIKETWWSSHTHDDLYVAVSERQRKNPPYDILDYAVLGYAFEEEINSKVPKYGEKVDYVKGYRFIHYYDLHPINFLTPSSYETSTTILDLIPHEF